MKRLYEIDHPYYGPEGYTEDLESFAELREVVEASDEDMSFVYRWDWFDYSRPQHDSLFVEGEDRSKQELRLFMVQPRKSQFWIVTCPVTHGQHDEVLTWLRGPRVLGALRKLWEPLLDGEPS
ncbi:hypothetical protein [Micromonospora deserti]|uniref:Uncharacterized protein n=1 Tax=Micromonospora deserti TaxID=2070366 RepID=A0A2W2DF98_9ACTN|nr:hypothetical protein [Micromonospora deserti]PZF98527.1 hypothetical protein C1I99_13280 [Micromonospora deserti]